MQKNRNTKLWKSIFVVLFFLLSLFPTLNRLTVKADTDNLTGVENSYPFPAFSWKDYYQSKFQGTFENSMTHGFTGVRAATRLYNELRYRLFHQGDSNTVILKDGSPIFEYYITEALGLDKGYYCTDEYIESLVDQIKRLEELAQEKGKELLVVVTPSKADFFRDQIPDRYIHMERFYSEEERGVHKLTAAMEEKGIPFVDGSALLQAGAYPFDIFPQTGIHYTREAAMQLVSAIVDKLGENGLQMKRIVSEGRDFTREPRHDSMTNDDDIWSLMNVFSRLDAQYSYPKEKEIAPEFYKTPKVFIQGGSFSYLLLELFRDHKMVDDCDLLFYAQSLYDIDENAIQIADFTNPEIPSRVEDSDIILLEVNVCAVNNMGSGFYPYLEGILSGKPVVQEGPKDPVSDPNVRFENLGNMEEYNGVAWRWSLGNSCRLAFSDVQEDDTLELRYWVPYTVLSQNNPNLGKSINIEILVNGKHYQTDSCSEDSIFTIRVPGSQRDKDGNVSVEIISPYSFSGIADGEMEETAFQLLYAGRAD